LFDHQPNSEIEKYLAELEIIQSLFQQKKN
jgi:hypothetical protein